MLQTRQKLKEAYDSEFTATIERAEKQIILAKHGRRLLSLLDDSPVVPGDTRVAYEHAAQARQILNDAEDDLREWQPESESFIDRPRAKVESKEEPELYEPGSVTTGDVRAPEATGALPTGDNKASEVAV